MAELRDITPFPGGQKKDYSFVPFKVFSIVIGIIAVIYFLSIRSPDSTKDKGSGGASPVSEGFEVTVVKDSVLRSLDGGKTFKAFFQIATSSMIGTADVLSISFHPEIQNKVVVTTLEDGLFVNSNRENLWAPIYFPPKKIYSFVLDKTSPDNRVFASGVVSENGRVFATKNTGKDWRVVYAEPGLETYVSALSQHTLEPSIMFAGTNNGTVIKSNDGGNTWKNIGSKVEGLLSAFEFDAVKRSFIYALSYNNKIYHSVNSGNDWLDWEEEKAEEVQRLKARASQLSSMGDSEGAKLQNDQAKKLADRNKENKRPRRIISIVSDPNISGTIYAGTASGLYRSQDYGKYWYKSNIIESAEEFLISSIAINPNNSNEIIFVAGRAFYKSVNGGNTWSVVPLDSSRRASFVAYDPFDKNVIFIGLSGK